MSTNTPDTPYTEIPALRRYNPSVAPVSMTGTTGMFHRRLVTRSTGSMISGLSGEGGLGVAAVTTLTVTAVSSTTLLRVRCTSSDGVPGSMRQLTLALAACGNAFSACPPSSYRSTHVGRCGDWQH